MIRPFAYTAQGLPLCLVPSTHIQGWNVLLCGVQLAEAFYRDGAAFVCPFSPRDTDTDGMPEIDRLMCQGPDPIVCMQLALDQFAVNFLAAARIEQLRLQLLEAQ